MEIRIKKTEIYWLVTKAEWDCKNLIIAGLHWYNSLHRYNLRASDLLSELQPQIYQVMSMCLKMLSLTLKIPFHIHLPLRKRKKKKKRDKVMSLKNFLYGSACVICVDESQELPISNKVWLFSYQGKWAAVQVWWYQNSS